jgi:hypothetical protein
VRSHCSDFDEPVARDVSFMDTDLSYSNVVGTVSFRRAVDESIIEKYLLYLETIDIQLLESYSIESLGNMTQITRFLNFTMEGSGSVFVTASSPFGEGSKIRFTFSDRGSFSS